MPTNNMLGFNVVTSSPALATPALIERATLYGGTYSHPAARMGDEDPNVITMLRDVRKDNGQLRQVAMFMNWNDHLSLEIESGSFVGRTSPGRGPAERCVFTPPLLFDGRRLFIDPSANNPLWAAIAAAEQNISDEEAARIAADSGLSTSISAEASARITGDANVTSAYQAAIAALLPTSASASATPTVLDRYSENTYTPALASSGKTFTYTWRTGRYTRIGNTVTVQASVKIASITGGGTGNTTFSLPFAVSSTSNNGACFSGAILTPPGSVTSYAQLTFMAAPGSTDATVISDTGQIDFIDHSLANGQELYLTGSYITDAA